MCRPLQYRPPKWKGKVAGTFNFSQSDMLLPIFTTIINHANCLSFLCMSLGPLRRSKGPKGQDILGKTANATVCRPKIGSLPIRLARYHAGFLTLKGNGLELAFCTTFVPSYAMLLQWHMFYQSPEGGMAPPACNLPPPVLWGAVLGV
eukprot:1138503-Pelagomonas_calceolata.AAC.14